MCRVCSSLSKSVSSAEHRYDTKNEKTKDRDHDENDVMPIFFIGILVNILLYNSTPSRRSLRIHHHIELLFHCNMPKILLLHGSRQTGQLLLGRMDKLRKKLESRNIQLVAPDAMFIHPDDASMRHWWNRHGNDYEELQETVLQIESIWMTDDDFVGIMGFSMGARLTHLLAVAHSRDPERFLKNLRFVIMVAGYEATLPDGFDALIPPPPHPTKQPLIDIHNLHVYGEIDRLIAPAQSQAVTKHYRNPQSHIHSGGHHVPMRAEDVRAYLAFIDSSLNKQSTNTCHSSSSTFYSAPKPMLPPSQQQQPALEPKPQPDPEALQIQQDEVEALTAIFPEEIRILSEDSPMQFTFDLQANDSGLWPPRPLQILFQYPYNYPEAALPKMQLVHDMNIMEFSYAAVNACLQTMTEAAQLEQGMPCVMSCIYAAKEYFESGAMAPHLQDGDDGIRVPEGDGKHEEDHNDSQPIPGGLLPMASPERIQACIQRGLVIAKALLQVKQSAQATTATGTTNEVLQGKGGSWIYTIGLVGKPSAGKSTFFNAATAFARQRHDADNALGGAAMAPHPFTTIDPNTGVALVPAPQGSCPEEDEYDKNAFSVGNTHGRDHKGRRLIPVLLKDVAGLVPGAYQGRGRGNKFLNDLCDADVLIHVMDASGTADTEGNAVGFEEDGMTPSSTASNPMNDLAWIRNELIEWVYTNLMVKWDTIRRKGRSKLEAMFNGYGQKAAVTWSILNAVEKEIEMTEHRDKALDHLDVWDEGDVHLLVSAFLGVRFPMALALNKADLPSSGNYIADILEALPAHGAHIGVPICARAEMEFIKETIEAVIENSRYSMKYEKIGEPPVGVWQCLQSAVTLKEPVIVFPVIDFTTYQPLPGLSNQSTVDSSLPTAGMVACLQKAGGAGAVPTNWDASSRTYTMENAKRNHVALRDVLVMKPGSTIEDVFLALKRLGAVGGEFIRAEASGNISCAPKPVPKHEVVSKNTRIVKIMTSKRSSWQAHCK